MARYEGLVAPLHRGTLLSCVAGVWLPMAAGEAHYRACDALAFTDKEIAEIGREVSVRVQATFLATLGKMARNAGVSPWTGLSQFPRLWDRVLDGGGVAVFRVGPKDARIEMVALPLLDIPYFRTALRAFIVAGCEIFTKKVYAKQADSSRGEWAANYEVAWV